jgi:GTPase SAR1 family protein
LIAIPLQDEYSLLPQNYTVGVHGYVLVYSVTSMKRYAWNKSCGPIILSTAKRYLAGS